MKTLQQQYTHTIQTEQKTSIFHRFIEWCEGQQNNRLGWLAFAITGHGCVFTPLTAFFIMLSGNHPVLWPFAIGAMGLALVTNLAALPTKITIPIFFLSLLIDLVIILNCVMAMVR